MKRLFELHKYGNTYQIALKVTSYADGNLAVQMLCWEEGIWEPWNVLTVNLCGRREKNCAYIDTNNNGMDILPWIIRHGLAVPTGKKGYSGYCVYPEFRFRESILREIDPAGYEQYLSTIGGEGENRGIKYA